MSRLFRWSALVLLVPVVAGCSGRGDPLFPELGDGKADVADRVDVKGALAWEVPVDGAMTEDLEFHGYTLDARAGALATVEVTQAGSSRSMDSSLFIYGPRSASGGYGSEAIAFDDDSGWGRLSRLRDLELAEGGTYLVVVGTHDGRGRGRYRLKASCPAGDCAPVAAGECHPVVAEAVLACVADQVANADAGTMTAIDALELCVDAEVIAPAYDQICASAPEPFCERPFEEFAAAQAVACRWELDDRLYDEMCVFGSWWTDLRRLPWLQETLQREIVSDQGLDPLTRDQVVAAVRSTGFEVDTVAEALAVVDGNVVIRHELWDASGRRAFTLMEFGAGDTALGLYFAFGTTDRVARINDSDVVECTVHTGGEERVCRGEDDCADGLACLGVASEIGRGRCVDLGLQTPGEGATCNGEVTGDCPQGSGLVCAGLTREPEGVCLPAWTRGRFATTPQQDIPDDDPAGARATLVAYGLADRDTDVEVLAFIQHDRPGDLRVTLIAPDGQEKLVFDGPADPDFLDLHEAIDFGGDAPVNGVWTLRVVDEAAGQTGRIESFQLWLGSRAGSP